MLGNKKKRIQELEQKLEKLSNLKLVVMKNGHPMNRDNKLRIVYTNIKITLENNKLEELSDAELLLIIKYIDKVIVSENEDSNEAIYLKQVAENVNDEIISRVSILVNQAKSLIQESNQLLIDDQLEQISYIEIYNLRVKLDYYLENVTINEKIEKLVTELGFLFHKRIGCKIGPVKVKEYEEACISI